MAADGSIIIDSTINDDGFVAGSRQLEAAIRRMTTSVSGLSAKAKLALESQVYSFAKLNSKVAEQAQKVDALRQKIAAYQDQKVPTEEYTQATKKVQDLEKALDKAIERQIKFVESGGDTNSRAFKGMEYDIEHLREQLDEAIIEKHRLETSGQGFKLAIDTEEARRDEELLRQEEEKLADMGERLGFSYRKLKMIISDYGGELNENTRYVGFFQSAVNGLKIAWNGLLNLPKNIFAGMVTGLKGLAQMAAKASLELAKLAGKGMVAGLKKLSAGIFGIHKSANKSNMSIGGSLKTILKYGLGIRSLYALINKLRTALVNGFKNLAQYSSTTNATLSGLMSSLEQCKNALATAFDPILQAVAPALNYLISLVTAAATAIAQLISALTGKNTFVKAVKVQKDYAKSLKGTGSAAKGAGEDAEGALASFDKLNVIADESASGGGGGGGGGGSGVEDMFETVDVSSEFGNLADAIKEAWKDADFTDVGSMLGAKIRDGLDKIPWSEIQSTAEKIGKSLATLLNGVVSTEGLPESIGRTIGEAINTGIIGVNAFLDNTAWDKVGEFIGKGANSLVDTIQWDALGHMFAAKFNAVFETINSFAQTFDWKNFGNSVGSGINSAIQTVKPETWASGLSGLVKGLLDSIGAFLVKVDWQEIGDKISTFFAKIDYSGIASSLAYGIGAAIASLASLIWGLIQKPWSAIMQWWESTANEDGQHTIEGLYNGIKQGLKNIGTWIRKNIFEPFIKGFKDVFGIHSPSTVMQEMGGYLVQGLLNGIINFIPNLIAKFGEIKDSIAQKWEEIKSDTSEKWEAIKSDISDRLNTAKENVLTYAGNIKDTVLDKWKDIKQDTSEKWEEVKKTLTTAWNDLKAKAGTEFPALKQTVLEAWTSIKNDSSWDNIKSNLFNIWNELLNTAREKFNDIKDTVKGVWDDIKNFGSNVKTSVAGITTSSSSKSRTMSLRTYTPSVEPVSLPHLASGTVVPPRAGEFAAILGDNKRETEVVSPLSTIEKALDNVFQKYGSAGGGNIEAHIYLDSRELGRSMVKFVRDETGRTGKNPVLV